MSFDSDGKIEITVVETRAHSPSGSRKSRATPNFQQNSASSPTQRSGVLACRQCLINA